MSQRRVRATRAALCAAIAAIPLRALATTYDLTGVTLNVPANTYIYTAADTLNTSAVTFSSSLTATLTPALNLVAGTTAFVNTGSLTLTGPLSGSASLLNSGTGTLVLTSPSPSFTGPASVAFGSTLRLTDPLALGPADAPTPVTLAGTLDVSGSLPVRPVALHNATITNSDTAHPATVSSLNIANSGATSLYFNNRGDLTFSSPIPFAANSLSMFGGNTLTYAAPATFTSGITVSGGVTLRLGIDTPFAGSGYLTVNGIATLDLNGFVPGCPISVASGGVISNSDPSATPALTKFPVGYPTFSGPGDILVNAPASSFAKSGTGTLTLNAPNPAFASGIGINNGTVRLGVANALGNSSSTVISLRSNSLGTGTLDLNGLPAPAGSYNFDGGALLNNNPNSTSTIPPSASVVSPFLTASGMIGGAGSIVAATYVPSNLTKVGAGTLTLGLAQSFLNLQINAGTVVLANTGSYQYNTTEISGGATLDLNGRPSSALTLGLHDDASIVNNNTSAAATIDTGFSLLSFGGAGSTFNLGGAGTLNLAASTAFNGKSLVKTGAGLLTFPDTFNPKDVTLRQGVLQLHSAAQLGYAPLYFHGGTLRTGPVDLPPQPVYNFISPWYVYDEGGTIDATADTTIGATGAVGYPLSATTGTLTKTGPGTLRLNSRYQTGINFTIDQGVLSFPTANAPLFARSTLTLNADDAFSCTGSLTGQLTVGALAGTGNLSAVSLDIFGNGAATTYAGTYSSPSLSVRAPAGAFTVTGALDTNTTVFGSLALGNGGAAGSASGTVNIFGTLSLDRSDSHTLPATLSGNGTLAHLGPGSTTVTLSPSSSLKLALQAGQLRLSPATPASVTIASLALSPTASFDLSTHGVSLTATAAYLPTLRSYLSDGLLFSSASDATRTLGYAFLTNHILISLTSPGDANLDGVVDPDDYALLDRGLATGGSFWWQGDFNYDGAIDANDYLAIDTTYLQQQGGSPSPSFLSQRESQFGPQYVSTLLATVPEPTLALSSILYLLSSLPLTRRRRASTRFSS